LEKGAEPFAPLQERIRTAQEALAGRLASLPILLKTLRMHSSLRYKTPQEMRKEALRTSKVYIT